MGAEKYVAMVLLALGGHAAPDINVDDLEDNSMTVIVLDSKNAFNSISRQVVFDILTGSFDGRTYGGLSEHNCPPPPPLFNLHFQSLRTFYGDDARMAFNAADGAFHEILSQAGFHQGCANAGKAFNIGSLAVVGAAAMQQHPDILSVCF